MKYLLILLAALLLVGCSVEVAHETENRSQNESLSTFNKSKTTVAVGILETPETSPETKHTAQESATSSSQRSQTTVKVIVPQQSSKILIPTPLPQAPRSPDGIQVTGNRNTVVFGDVHIHEHKHFHVHETQKPNPVRIDVRVELGDRINERERRRRMVEARIARFFPRYGK